ncbi:unnamed protein product [Angiostrongylus costaricensis]|uniref:C2H2-type domain-containing protein n=1 Tax=Angiostrongylus costaricensis TaxID=334426 RepID=A0A158PL26_ANGCS|nr:unnamed protein product [Angiostrongylus costaricensis]
MTDIILQFCKVVDHIASLVILEESEQRIIRGNQTMLKPRRPCTVCGKWTTTLYMHMIYSHDWTDKQVNELKKTIRNERRKTIRKEFLEQNSTEVNIFFAGICEEIMTSLMDLWEMVTDLPHMRDLELTLKKAKPPKRQLLHTSSASLCTHLARFQGSSEQRIARFSPSKIAKDKEFIWFLEGGRPVNTRQLPPRPLYMPALPDQLSESAKGSVICPVPRCTGRFTNHDSLCYHCMLEHAELGAAGTPQNFAIRQYRFDTIEEYKTNEYSDGSIDVTCCFGHIFHDLDPTALRLNERQCDVLRKLLEQHVAISDICAQMKSEYPPINRLHYTTTNDIRNLALRLGLPIRVKEKKALRNSLNYNAKECAEKVQEVKDSTVISDHSDDCLSLHSDSQDEYKLEFDGRSDEEPLEYDPSDDQVWFETIS